VPFSTSEKKFVYVVKSSSSTGFRYTVNLVVCTGSEKQPPQCLFETNHILKVYIPSDDSHIFVLHKKQNRQGFTVTQIDMSKIGERNGMELAGDNDPKSHFDFQENWSEGSDFTIFKEVSDPSSFFIFVAKPGRKSRLFRLSTRR